MGNSRLKRDDGNDYIDLILSAVIAHRTNYYSNLKSNTLLPNKRYMLGLE